MYKILIVDDDAFNLAVMGKILEIEYETMSFRSGVQLLSYLQTGTADLILLDYLMPEMDGLEATTVIRKLERADATTIPIVAATASAFEDDRIAIFKAGMNGYLLKPLNDESVYSEMMKQIFPERE